MLQSSPPSISCLLCCHGGLEVYTEYLDPLCEEILNQQTASLLSRGQLLHLKRCWLFIAFIMSIPAARSSSANLQALTLIPVCLPACMPACLPPLQPLTAITLSYAPLLQTACSR